MEDACAFHQDFSSCLGQVLPMKTDLVMQYGKPETILAIVKKQTYEGYTDGAYLAEIARCVEINDSFSKRSLLQSLCERSEMFREHGPVFPTVFYDVLKTLELRYGLRADLSSKTKDGSVVVMSLEELQFIQAQCESQGLKCPERDMIDERVAMAERTLAPLLKPDRHKLYSIKQFLEVINHAQRCGVGHPR